MLNTYLDDARMLERICRGNRDAMDFLATHWLQYVHEIDDLIDGSPEPEAILSTFAKAALLYSHPFYLANLASLRTVALICTSTYADSVAWEKDADTWKQEWADHNRHVGMDMVIAVALICGGYDHARTVSQELRNVCWHEHHDPDGKPE